MRVFVLNVDQLKRLDLLENLAKEHGLVSTKVQEEVQNSDREVQFAFYAKHQAEIDKAIDADILAV